MDYKQSMVNWGVVLIVFMLFAWICIWLIFTPTINHVTIGNTDYFDAPSPLTVEGLAIRGQTWREFPNYNIGLGIIALSSFAGAIYACKVMYSLWAAEDGALQSKIRRVES